MFMSEGGADIGVVVAFCDCACISDTGSPGTTPILVIRDRATNAHVATAVSDTDVDECAVRFSVGFAR